MVRSKCPRPQRSSSAWSRWRKEVEVGSDFCTGDIVAWNGSSGDGEPEFAIGDGDVARYERVGGRRRRDAIVRDRDPLCREEVGDTPRCVATELDVKGCGSGGRIGEARRRRR